MEDRPFPTEDALCEHCGYPIKGLAFDADCPECGQAVAQSSPAHRTLRIEGQWLGLKSYWRLQLNVLFQPRRSFRSLDVSSVGRVPEQLLLRNSLLAGLIIGAIVFLGSAYVITPRFHRVPIESFFKIAGVGALVICVLTFIEVLGVAAFSKRRGWRVPFPLARRVCCLASVGWLPGAVMAGVGIWLFEVLAVGRPWFDHLLGLVRVGWLCYGALFVLSFLWFETLVWIAVRQVRFANAWPDPPSPPSQTPPKSNYLPLN